MSKDRRLSDALGDLLSVPEQPEPRRRIEFDHERGEGTITLPPAPANVEPDWSAHLIALGYDPAAYAIDHNGIRTSVWEAQTKDGSVQTLRSVRARVIAKAPGAGIDADALIAEIRKHRPPRRKPEPAENGGALIWCCSDIQMGKSDGDSVDGTVQRFLTAIDRTEARVKELRRAGRQLDHLVIACLGDLVEACDGHYPAQAFNVALNRREQARVMRRLLLKAVERLAPLFPKVTLAAVAGNHGEYRRGGKAFTDPGQDNEDLALPEQVLDILSANPDVFGHIQGAVGGDPFTRVIEAGGHIIGMLHGHMAREAGPAQQKIQRWFERQAAAKAPVSAADVILSGHYHHMTLNESNGRVTFVSCPALDGGSDWYRAEKAAQHLPGLLTFALYPDNPRITDIAVL